MIWFLLVVIIILIGVILFGVMYIRDLKQHGEVLSAHTERMAETISKLKFQIKAIEEQANIDLPIGPI
jgi:predicted Holliday junction resolvase-like endonuclease